MNHEVFAALGEALSRGEEAALVTIVSSNGSTPQRVGAKMLVFGDGRIVGTVGGGCYEHDAIGRARQVLASRKAVTVKYDLNDDFAEETGLVCGGQMEVFIEPIEASPAVYIFGAGHVGYYLAKMAHEAGFGVHVIDDRAAFANSERFPFAVVPEFLVGYRQRAGSMSHNVRDLEPAYRQVIARARARHPELPARLFRWSRSRFSMHQGRALLRSGQPWRALPRSSEPSTPS